MTLRGCLRTSPTSFRSICSTTGSRMAFKVSSLPRSRKLNRVQNSKSHLSPLHWHLIIFWKCLRLPNTIRHSLAALHQLIFWTCLHLRITIKRNLTAFLWTYSASLSSPQMTTVLTISKARTWPWVASRARWPSRRSTFRTYTKCIKLQLKGITSSLRLKISHKEHLYLIQEWAWGKLVTWGRCLSISRLCSSSSNNLPSHNFQATHLETRLNSLNSRRRHKNLLSSQIHSVSSSPNSPCTNSLCKTISERLVVETWVSSRLTPWWIWEWGLSRTLKWASHSLSSRALQIVDSTHFRVLRLKTKASRSPHQRNLKLPQPRATAFLAIWEA